MSDTVAAIVPAYNEASRIQSVLKALTNTTILDEVVVVDDGSTDNLVKIVRVFPQARYIKHAANRGKSAAMATGVQATDAATIFFCDADLTGLTPTIVEDIIRPVVDGKAIMSIGIRNNISQKSFRPFAMNSGERALPRRLWETLPSYYKHGFRIEVGLNYWAQQQGGHVQFRTYPYYQTFKEIKYGWWQGSKLRWQMNRDVAMAILRATIIDRVLPR
jgi:glycosyltransferase involved in cell wall biosynthesis